MNFVADPVIVECTLNTIALEGHGQCPGSPFEVLHWLFKCFALIYCIILVRVASTALKVKEPWREGWEQRTLPHMQMTREILESNRGRA